MRLNASLSEKSLDGIHIFIFEIQLLLVKFFVAICLSCSVYYSSKEKNKLSSIVSAITRLLSVQNFV